MTTKQDVVIFGDIHERFAHYNRMLEDLKPDLSIACGDFGIWPDYMTGYVSKPKSAMNLLKNSPCHTYFIDGNHENFTWLNNKVDGEFNFHNSFPNNVYNITHQRRGTIKQINGLNFLFMGGAESIDKQVRVEGVSWFRDESITWAEINNTLVNVESNKINIDVIISHTAPMEFDIVDSYLDTEPSRKLLSTLLAALRPKLWFFGHFHTYKTGNHGSCKWIGLDMLPNRNCYVKLNDFAQG